MAVVVKLVNTPDCGSGIREFESRRSPQEVILPSKRLEGFLFILIEIIVLKYS